MFWDSDVGMKFISVLLGFGLASLFRQVCKEDKCKIIKGPSVSDIQRHIYQIDNKCYQYKPIPTMCDTA